MSDIPQLENKVSVQDIDVEKYKTKVAELASEQPNETQPDEGESAIHVWGANQHTITFVLDNTGTAFDIKADDRTFADWGSFSGAPTNVTGPKKFTLNH
jgi:hypothetical protein